MQMRAMRAGPCFTDPVDGGGTLPFDSGDESAEEESGRPPQRGRASKRRRSAAISKVYLGARAKFPTHGAVPLGPEYQVELPPPLTTPLARPPAPPPRCECSTNCVWLREHWFCAHESGGCGYQSGVPPGPAVPTPLCPCQLPCKWLLGRWWCRHYPRESGGCSLELRTNSRAEPAIVDTAAVSSQVAASSAAMLTAAAYGLSEFAFVAPSDCGLGLFARAPLCAGQFVIEYVGPILPLECIHKGEFVMQIPGEAPSGYPTPASPHHPSLVPTVPPPCLADAELCSLVRTGSDLAIDGACDNAPAGRPRGHVPCPAIFANHSSSPNVVVQHWPSVDGARERLALVTTVAVAAGQELRINYENGGARGQYWGRGVRPCTPVEHNWRNRRIATPPPSGAPPVVRYLPRLLEYNRWREMEARDRQNGVQPPLHAPPRAPRALASPPHASWCDTTLRMLIAQLQSTAWFHECVQKGIGKAPLWGLVASHFPGRSPLECQERWRQVCQADEASRASREHGRKALLGSQVYTAKAT